jgi:hypothetical protein
MTGTLHPFGGIVRLPRHPSRPAQAAFVCQAIPTC